LCVEPPFHAKSHAAPAITKYVHTSAVLLPGAPSAAARLPPCCSGHVHTPPPVHCSAPAASTRDKGGYSARKRLHSMCPVHAHACAGMMSLAARLMSHLQHSAPAGNAVHCCCVAALGARSQAKTTGRARGRNHHAAKAECQLRVGAGHHALWAAAAWKGTARLRPEGA
jgi:hypothetical protein